MRRDRRNSFWLFATLVSTSAICCAEPTTARGGLRDDFESAEPVWRDVGGDARYRVEQHARTGDGPHSGRQAEFWEISCPGDGTAVYLSYDLGRAPVIDETSATLWVRADRPGIRFSARVVFPRTMEPGAPRPVSALLQGSISARPGQWERLTLSDVRKQVEQQARVLRVQLKTPVDTGEAYIDRLLVNAYTGAGRTRLWLDDLEVTGFVTAGDAAPATVPNETASAPLKPISRASSAPSPTPEVITPAVELKGQDLLVRGRPFFPRMLEYQGESPAAIVALGFNAVRMRTTPTREFLGEAERAGLWIVCPPPRPPEVDDPYGASASADLQAFGPLYAPILAWDLGEGLTAADVDRVKRWAEFVHRRDLPRPRPTVCHAAADIRLMSRQVDILLVYRLPLGTSFELADYGAWLRGRAGLARPGTPIWTIVQTEPIRQLATQVQLFSLSSPPPTPVVDGEAVRQIMFESLAAGARGVCFASSSSLSADDSAGRARAQLLRLLNAEFELIDIWSASGSFMARIAGIDHDRMTAFNSPTGVANAGPGILHRADVSAALMQIDRGHLLLPLWSGSGAQFVPGQSAGAGISFVLPGVPESVDAYEITPGGLRPLERKRVAGGVAVTIAEFNLTTLVLLTQDPQLTAAVLRRLATVGSTIAQLQREAADTKLRQTESVHAQLQGLAPPIREAGVWLDAANNSLRSADRWFAAGNMREAYLDVRRSLRPAALVERADWARAVQAAGSPTATPFTASFATLPEHWQMLPRLHAVQSWVEALPAGDFESLDRFVSSGWKHYQFGQDGVAAEADLSRQTRAVAAAAAATAKAPRIEPGPTSFCLRLAARPTDQRATQGLLESSPVWVVSPPIAVRAGQLLRISGWVHVPEALTGSYDGLMVYDSIGGDVLAERFDKTETPGWRRFTYYRIAPVDGTASLTIALTGFGEAFVDDLKIAIAP